MAPSARPGRATPGPTDQLQHLAARYGLAPRPEAAPLAERPRPSPGLAGALVVPYYALLYNANVVPREAVAQKGRLGGVLAVDVTVHDRRVEAVIDRAERIARVLMAEYDAAGAVFAIQSLEWDQAAGEGTLVIEVASGRGSGDSLATVAGGDLSAVLEAILDAVRPPGAAFAISRDPVDLRDDPTSGWRWVHPVRPEDAIEDFTTLLRDAAFEVLTLLVSSPEGSCRPLKSIPEWYVDLPGLDP